MEGEVWTGRVDRLGGEAVQQICGGVEPFYLVARQNRSLKKQGTQHIIDGVNNAFGFTVLWRSVGTRNPQNDPVGGEDAREEALSNSRPLSHWTALMVRPNCVET
jgi:hypothetical protein